MALRESLRDLKDIQYNEQKKTESKKQFENTIYKIIKKEFNNTTLTAANCRLELLQNKDAVINLLTPRSITLYEASKTYNRILNELYKEYTTNNDKNDYKQSLNELYNELENYFIKYNSGAYNILLDLQLKKDILEKYILLFPESKRDFQTFYNKTIKTLYKEFSNIEDVEKIQESKKINFAPLFWFILRILLFPFWLTFICLMSYKPGKRK